MRTTLIYFQIKASMEDGTFVAFCHFLSDLFSSISRYSLLLQRNDIILPQVKREKGGHWITYLPQQDSYIKNTNKIK